ncbi:hypothetical protein JYA35_08870 [Bacillus velezensis]|uniref:hypothetical protein n=1 Tax=Bacillus velezensis TaxID=492670 RepID=UPI0019D37DD3|nr:hypothetical protein [Bacillus velezensis]MBN7742703.1 hypothetical protein [Bacillus velezensis]
MREEIQVLLEEIEELEMALSKSDNNTVSVVLQEAIDKRRNEIGELKPNGYVLADVVLNDGTELKRCLVFTVTDRMGSQAVTELDEAREIFEKDKEVYLQQEHEDGNFAGDIGVHEIATYNLEYENGVTE